MKIKIKLFKLKYKTNRVSKMMFLNINRMNKLVK